MSGNKAIKPLDLPLTGQRLVEASAGTGKTFTLAGLYLRLLIEQGRTVREILVMTFTRAATQELRERIRWWLARAATLARDPGAADPATAEDEIIADLLGRTDEDPDTLARRLTEAATRMDEATITTIHGFSRMAVLENAFDSGIAFDRGEQTEDGPLIEEAITDYWRRQIVGGTAPELASLWPTPAACIEALSPLIKRPHQRLVGPENEAAQKAVQKGRDDWMKQRDALQTRLEDLAEAGELNGRGKLAKQIGHPEDVPALMAELDEAVAAGPVNHPLFASLSSEQFGKQLKGKAAKEYTPDAVTEAVDAVMAAIPLARIHSLGQAADQVRERVSTIKAERRLFSYDDLIQGLHQAITNRELGPTLARALHERWPTALVDEFQDTDPLQYQILQRIYGGRDQGALIMIGDPKQAIYAFRGGDVFAYLQATDDADGCYHLDTNFRSTAGVITAVDQLFDRHERPFVLNEMAFRPVNADENQGRGLLTIDGDPAPPLTFWSPPAGEGDLIRAPDAKSALLNQCVATIRRLLDPETEVRRQQNTQDKPLHPRDICVLVTSNTEAREIQHALAQQNIPAASGHRDSVFNATQAQELVRLLRAVATPADAPRLRWALIGELFGCRLGELQALAEDETRWQGWYEHFQRAHRRWADHGVLAMLEPLFQAAAPRLLTLEDGERRMTNWLHLGEQVQAAEPEAFGMAGLIRWLEEQIEQAGQGENEAAQLRLESEADRVQIVTIHRSKGLEYPVVMVPFAHRIGTVGGNDARPDNGPFAFHDDQHQAWLDPRSKNEADAETIASAVREHKAEAMRLLYVAITRARQAIYLGWGPINGAQDSALAWLLHAEDGCAADVWQTQKEDKGWFTPERVSARLEALASESDGAIHIEPVGPEATSISRLEPTPPPAGAVRCDLPERRPFWGMLSFSALVRNDHGPIARAGAEDESRAQDRLFAEPSPDWELPSAALEGLAGPNFGTAIHDILEQAEFTNWPKPADPLTPDQERLVRSHLLRHGIPVASGVSGNERVAAVGALVGRTLQSPLPDLGPLAQMPRDRLQVEMPFTLRLGGEPARSILELLREYGYASALPGSQSGRVLRGLMQGYIDLVAEADGRYWVLDYKTNRLPSPTDYAPERLGEAVQASHYDLQYLIYLTALHRYLRQRLPDYDPARHLGGAQYLFLRGLTSDTDGYGIFVDRPDPELIRALDAHFDATATLTGDAHGQR